jgi:RNA polymerase sigma factor for flagellar operon FliA
MEEKDRARMLSQIVIDYVYLVRHVVYRVGKRLPKHVELDDLFQCGLMGLMDAIEKFDPTRNLLFKTYAEFRIYGTIIDALRKEDILPRSARDARKREEQARNQLEKCTGSTPSDREVAQFLGISLQEFQRKAERTRQILISIEGGGKAGDSEHQQTYDYPAGDSNNPFFELSRKQRDGKISRALDRLPERERLVIRLRYFDELTIEEIGTILEVSQSRVSQLHTRALALLKQRLNSREFRRRDDLDLTA